MYFLHLWLLLHYRKCSSELHLSNEFIAAATVCWKWSTGPCFWKLCITPLLKKWWPSSLCLSLWHLIFHSPVGLLGCFSSLQKYVLTTLARCFSFNCCFPYVFNRSSGSYLSPGVFLQWPATSTPCTVALRALISIYLCQHHHCWCLFYMLVRPDGVPSWRIHPVCHLAN